MSRAPKPTSERELMLRAQALGGQDVQALAAALGVALPARPSAAKGFVGQLVEAALGADADAGERPDFVGLNIELKTVPVKPIESIRSSRPTQPVPSAKASTSTPTPTPASEAAAASVPLLAPQESTFVCSISLPVQNNERFATSRLARRLQAVLLVPVLGAKLAPLGERTFFRPRLWRPTPAQWQQLEADWEDLLGAIGAGRSMGLTAREGVALQVRPKAAHSRVRAIGQLGDGAGLVLPQGFYLRARFLAEVLACS